MSAHVSSSELQAWLDGSLSADARSALQAHLASGCTVCEDLVDATFDADLLARLLEAERAAPASPPPWRAPIAAPPAKLHLLPAATEASPAVSSGRSSWGRRYGLAGLLLAAVAAIALWVPRPPDSAIGVKGSPSGAIPVLLQVALARQEAGRLVPDRVLTNGESVYSDSILLFSMSTTSPAARYLGAETGGERIPLYPPEGATAAVEPAGERRVIWQEQWVALDLSDLPGELQLQAAAFPAALAPGAAWPEEPTATLKLLVREAP